jgi:hypothetical protein
MPITSTHRRIPKVSLGPVFLHRHALLLSPKMRDINSQETGITKSYRNTIDHEAMSDSS